MVEIAKRAEQSASTSFATGEHHNPPFVAVLPHHDHGLRRGADEPDHPVDRHDPHHDQRPGQDRRGLREPPAPRRRADGPDARARATPARSTRGSARTSATGIALAVEHYALLHRLWREDVVDWQGRFRTPLTGLHLRPHARSTALPPFVWHGSIRSPGDRRAGRLLRRRLLPQQHLLAVRSRAADGRPLPPSGSSTTATGRPTRRSSGSAGRCSCAPTRRPRSASSGRTSTTRRSTAAGPSLEDYMAQTPLTVGSPQQVIDRTMGFREIVGDYQRQLFLVDHAGLPPRSPSSSSRCWARRSCPVLRREFAALKPAHVPDAPTHASRLAAARAAARRRRRRRRRSPPTSSPAPGRGRPRRGAPLTARIRPMTQRTAHRRQRRPQPAVVDAAAGRPPRGGDGARGGRGARRRRSTRGRRAARPRPGPSTTC